MSEELTLDEKIDKAIEKMSDQAKATSGDSGKALQYSQAALNLAQVKQIMKGPKKPRASAS